MAEPLFRILVACMYVPIKVGRAYLIADRESLMDAPQRGLPSGSISRDFFPYIYMLALQTLGSRRLEFRRLVFSVIL